VYDTVRFSCDIGRLDAAHLSKRGWTTQRTTRPDGAVIDKAILNAESLPRLTWYDSGYVTAECSLPKLLRGENVSLVNECDLPLAFKRVSEYVGAAIGVVVDVADWNLARCDYCYCWQVGQHLPLYLEALSHLHLSRHDRQTVGAGTVAFHSAANKLQFYDKHAESGLDAARGILRFEATIRDTRYLAKQLKVGRTASALLTDKNAVRTLRYFLVRLGLNEERPIVSKAGALERTVEEFGVRGAEKLWLFAQLYEQYGAKAKELFYSRNTFYRRRKALAEAGLLAWHNGAEDVLLPALVIHKLLE